MLTIFGLPKAFVGISDVIQHNAIASWKRVAEDAQVILFGDEAGIAEAAKLHGAEHVPQIERNDHGTPLLSDAFARAQAVARFANVAYANADIVFLDDFARLCNSAGERADGPFLMVGQRTDLDVPQRLAFDRGWQNDLRRRAERDGSLHGPSGIDYFVFPRGQLQSMPPFPVGRPLWDNWMIYDARRRAIPVIDATPSLMVVHQNHDYGHVKGGKMGAFRGVEAERNQALAGAGFFPLTVEDATQAIVDGQVVRCLDHPHLRRRLLTWLRISPSMRAPTQLARRLKLAPMIRKALRRKALRR